MTIPDVDPVANVARRAKRERLLGEDPACVFCGMANIDALLPMARSILEAHHVVGRANDGELTVPVCRNCHAELTEGYRDAGVPLNRPPTLLHRIARILLAIGAMLAALGRKCTEWGTALLHFIQNLDSSLPAWRAVVGATP